MTEQGKNAELKGSKAASKNEASVHPGQAGTGGDTVPAGDTDGVVEHLSSPMRELVTQVVGIRGKTRSGG